MREIKFRAWDKTTKTMYSVREIEWADGDILSLYIGLHSSDADNVELMQFTGIKDKNAREMYSGDLVEDDRGEVGVIVEVRCGQWFMWLHEYKCFCKGDQVVIAEPTSDMQTATWLARNKVIGNIYENPELLNPDGDYLDKEATDDKSQSR